jgi:hypothetical protein
VRPVGPPIPEYTDEASPAATAARGRGTLRHDSGEGGYVFALGDVQYRLPTDGPAMQSGLLCVDGRVGEGPWVPLLREAGMLYRDADGRVYTPPAAARRLDREPLRPTARGKTLSLRIVERAGGATLRRAVQVRLTGQTLILQFEAAAASAGAGHYSGVTLGPVGPPDAREVAVPYCPERLLMLAEGTFLSAYVDRLRSEASAAPQGAALYHPAGDGQVRAIRETAYLTLSRDPLAALPALTQEPSPQRPLLARRVVCELTSAAPYAELRARVQEIARYGLRDLLLILRDWRHSRGRRQLPSHYPADPDRGSNEEFRLLVETMREQGWQVALEEEYTLLSEDGAYWNPLCVARDAQGAFRAGLRDPWAIAADKMIAFARLEASKIRRNYLPDAAFLGSHIAWHPGDLLQQIDMDAANPWARTGARAVAATKHLCQYYRGVYGGPVLGDGGEGSGRFDAYYAGYADGVSGFLDGGRDARVIPDYALREVRPRAIGYGLGSYARFAGRTGKIKPAEVDWDTYRATQIALGHAGLLATTDLELSEEARWTPCGRIDQAFTEYFLLRALQEQYLEAPLTSVEYWSGLEWLDLGRALAAGLDLAQARLHLTYGNGLTIFVNRHPRQEWNVPHAAGPPPGRPPGEATFTLPPGGWVAWNDSPRLHAYSALVPGGRADVALCDAYRFLNARSNVARRIEGITTDGAAAIVKSRVPDRTDLYLVGGRTLAESGNDLIKSSDRCDFSLLHTGEREAELMVLDSDSGRSCNVTLYYFGPEWHGARLGLQEWQDGAWRRAPNQVQHTKRGVQVARMLPGTLYRLFLP